MDETLKKNIKKFFTIISPFVQIILLKDGSNNSTEATDINENEQQATNQEEPMDISLEGE